MALYEGGELVARDSFVGQGELPGVAHLKLSVT
jgi:hypothetical protein